jgi:hypothetical protein
VSERFRTSLALNLVLAAAVAFFVCTGGRVAMRLAGWIE